MQDCCSMQDAKEQFKLAAMTGSAYTIPFNTQACCMQRMQMAVAKEAQLLEMMLH